MLAFNPSIKIFGIDVYYYAIIIVSGMAVAIWLFSRFLKKKGYDPYDAVDYALWIIPFAILGARLYFFLFPYDGTQSDWSRFWNFRDGGLGIYGGVIAGYIAGWIVARVKKHNFFQVMDCIVPGLLIAQCIGRWGNFVNQEAYGNLITDPNWQFFPFAVFIDAKGAWYQATFFYESFCTGIGFIISLFLLKSKNYKTGWLASFYGIYYGIVRYTIEALRSDSLYLWIGGYNTGIKISQAVAVFTILFGLYRLLYSYRKELYQKYVSLFSNDKKRINVTFVFLSALIVVLVGGGIACSVLGDANVHLAGATMFLAALLPFFGLFATYDESKTICKKCDEKAKCEISEDGTVTCLCEKCNEKKCLTCPDGEYLDSDDNCQSCSDKFTNCASCTESECTSCADGYVLTNPTSNTPCS